MEDQDAGPSRRVARRKRSSSLIVDSSRLCHSAKKFKQADTMNKDPWFTNSFCREKEPKNSGQPSRIHTNMNTSPNDSGVLDTSDALLADLDLDISCANANETRSVEICGNTIKSNINGQACNEKNHKYSTTKIKTSQKEENSSGKEPIENRQNNSQIFDDLGEFDDGDDDLFSDFQGSQRHTELSQRVDEILSIFDVPESPLNSSKVKQKTSTTGESAKSGLYRSKNESACNSNNNHLPRSKQSDLNNVNQTTNENDTKGMSLKEKLKQKMKRNSIVPSTVNHTIDRLRETVIQRAQMEAEADMSRGKDVDIGPFYGLPSKVQSLLETQRGITKFYDWQDECLRLPAVMEGRNLIYSLPTSGGKTLVAEILILRELMCKKRDAILILPYVSIVQEKVRNLCQFAVDLDFLVEEYAGSKGRFPPIKRRRKRTLYIATLEKAHSLVNSLIETKNLDSLGLAVVDELHMIGEGGSRGATLEAALLKLLHCGGTQIIGMSATLNNISDLQQFLQAEVYSNNFRPLLPPSSNLDVDCEPPPLPLPPEPPHSPSTMAGQIADDDVSEPQNQELLPPSSNLDMDCEPPSQPPAPPNSPSTMAGQIADDYVSEPQNQELVSLLSNLDMDCESPPPNPPHSPTTIAEKIADDDVSEPQNQELVPLLSNLDMDSESPPPNPPHSPSTIAEKIADDDDSEPQNQELVPLLSNLDMDCESPPPNPPHSPTTIAEKIADDDVSEPQNQELVPLLSNLDMDSESPPPNPPHSPSTIAEKIADDDDSEPQNQELVPLLSNLDMDCESPPPNPPHSPTTIAEKIADDDVSEPQNQELVPLLSNLDMDSESPPPNPPHSPSTIAEKIADDDVSEPQNQELVPLLSNLDMDCESPPPNPPHSPTTIAEKIADDDVSEPQNQELVPLLSNLDMDCESPPPNPPHSPTTIAEKIADDDVSEPQNQELVPLSSNLDMDCESPPLPPDPPHSPTTIAGQIADEVISDSDVDSDDSVIFTLQTLEKCKMKLRIKNVEIRPDVDCQPPVAELTGYDSDEYSEYHPEESSDSDQNDGEIPPPPLKKKKSSTSESKTCESRTCETSTSESKTCESRTCETSTSESKTCESRTCETSTSESKTCESRTCETSTSENKLDSEEMGLPLDDGKISMKYYASDIVGIYIVPVVKDIISKKGDVKRNERVYNKLNACPYCCHVFVNFEQHLIKHAEEEEVKEIMKLPSRSKTRRNMIDILRYRGNHMHNKKTIRDEKGMFIPSRRPCKRDDWSIEEYGPCPHCKVWMRKKLLYRHRKNCVSVESHCKESSSEVLLQSDILAGRIKLAASVNLVHEVYTILRNDDVARVAKSDCLIVQMGNGALDRNIGNKAMRRYYASSVMRLLARLLIEMRKLQESEQLKKNLSFYDAIHPLQYDNFVTAVFEVCGNVVDAMEDEEDLQTPSNAIKLSYDIMKMCHAKITIAIDDDDKERGEKHRKCTKRFLDKFRGKWFIDVKKRARHVLRERKMNTKIELPIPEDIVRVADYMKENLKSEPPQTAEEFRELQLLVLARLISYNRRRPGEVQALRMKQYASRTRGLVGTHETLKEHLNEVEMKLVASQEVMEIRGKKDRKVPLIIPQDCITPLGYITNDKLRKNFGVQSIFVFSSNSAGSIHRGYYALRHTVTAVGNLEKPELIVATKLRKYMACVTQVLSLDKNDMVHVLNHMGHTWDVHRDFYRQYSSVIERLDVSKLLLLQDTNQVGDYRKKGLNSIDIEKLNKTGFADIVSIPDTPEEYVDADEPEFDPHPYDKDDELDTSGVFNFEDGEERHTRKKRKPSQRHLWREEEEQELRKLFPNSFKRKKLPGLKDITNQIRGSDMFKDTCITPSAVKNKIDRMIH